MVLRKKIDAASRSMWTTSSANIKVWTSRWRLNKTFPYLLDHSVSHTKNIIWGYSFYGRALSPSWAAKWILSKHGCLAKKKVKVWRIPWRWLPSSSWWKNSWLKIMSLLPRVSGEDRRNASINQQYWTAHPMRN